MEGWGGGNDTMVEGWRGGNDTMVEEGHGGGRMTCTVSCSIYP